MEKRTHELSFICAIYNYYNEFLFKNTKILQIFLSYDYEYMSENVHPEKIKK